MAPAATDTVIGARVVDSLQKGETTVEEFFRSSMDKAQLDDTGMQTSQFHVAHHIPFITRDFAPRLTPMQLADLQASSQRLRSMGVPSKTPGYEMDETLGIGMIHLEFFNFGWRSIKDRVYIAMLDFIDHVPAISLPTPRQDKPLPNGKTFALTEANTKRLEEFFGDSSNRPYVEALNTLYQAGAEAFESDEAKVMAVSQRREYHLGKGGMPGFRVTMPLAQLIDHIDTKVTDAYQGVKERVPEAAKTSFVDAITRRTDQPID